MKNTSIVIIVFLIFWVGAIWLQIFLSKKKNKWLGLVIPIICIIFSIMSVLSISVFSSVTNTIVRTETADGVLIQEVQGEDNIAESNKPGIGEILAMVIPVFLVTNIPTIIFLAIYFACREKIKINCELKKMNVQDLE